MRPFALASGGHIAGTINPPADNKRSYRADGGNTNNPTARWENGVVQPGSWWSDWVSWLAGLSRGPVPAPPMGTDRHPAIAAAPGTYVLD